MKVIGARGSATCGEKGGQDLDTAYFPLKPIVPYLEVVHDRMMVEVLRGCTRLPLCQAGFFTGPSGNAMKLLVGKPNN